MTVNRQIAQGEWATKGLTKAGPLTSAGTNQATGFLITNEYSEFGTVAASSAAVLPTNAQVPLGLSPGDVLVVVNLGANALLVFPPVGGFINALAVNVSLSVAAGKVAEFRRTLTTDKWVCNLSG
jgi:hypothetical protein